MTTLAQQAVEQLASLPEKDQDRIAAIILDEIEDARWDRTSTENADGLRKLADSEDGPYEPLDPERL